MRGTDLLDKMDLAAPSFVETAEQAGRPKRNPWVRWGALAACLALVVFGSSRLTLADPTPTASQPPAPDYGGTQPTPTVDGLPLLTVPEDRGSYGFEGYMAYDISELTTRNGWNEDVVWETLPVYQNPVTYDDAGKVEGGVDWGSMERRLLDTAARMGLDPENLTITENAPDKTARERIQSKYAAVGETVPAGAFDPTELRIELEDMTLSVDGSGMVEVEWTPALTLPEELRFDHDSTAEELEAVAAYLLEEYRDLIGMERPTAVLSGGDRDIYGRQSYALFFCETGKESMEAFLQAELGDRVRFVCDDEGKLWLFRATPSNRTKPVGNYPIVTAEEARKLLLAGNYITTVPHAIMGQDESLIRRVELVYRTSRYDETFMPYYRFYVELPEMEREGGLKTYGAYYVPAVESRYLTALPVWDGSWN